MIAAWPAAVLLAAALLVPASDDRSDLPEPSADQIARSIVRYSLEGSVEKLVQQEEGSIILGSDVLFAYNSAELDDGARTAVAALLEAIPQGARVSVDGHTDSRGGDTVNIPLSQARAQAVADLVIVERPDLTLTVQGLASSNPVAEEYPNGEADYDAMARNRRVVLTVQP